MNSSRHAAVELSYSSKSYNSYIVQMKSLQSTKYMSFTNPGCLASVVSVFLTLEMLRQPSHEAAKLSQGGSNLIKT